MWCNFAGVLLWAHLVTSYRILGYFPVPSVSHQIVFQPIWRELSWRGHQVTVITPNPLKDPKLTNLTEIDMSQFYKEPSAVNVEEMRNSQSPFKKLPILNAWTHQFDEGSLKNEKVRALIKDKGQQFDLVMVQSFFSLTGLAFGARFDAPLIGLSSHGGFLQVLDAVGNPSHPALTANCLTDLGPPMSFTERMRNFLFTVWFRFYFNWYVVPRSDEIAREHFGDIPYLGDLQHELKLLLLNTNPTLHYVVPNVPGIIEIGQMHIKPKKPLPKEIKEYLDKSERGVIYFSLGSNVKSSNSSAVFIESVQKALSELPYDVMWKWETDYMPNKPDNVFTQKWFPQQDILGHPKIKAFVTQGGLQSMEEAITNGVPLVVIPFLGDQHYNARRMLHMKIATSVNSISLTKDKLKNAILEVIENKEYKNNVLKYRSRLLDQPMTGLEKAIWWIEYVLRHKGDVELTLPAANQMPFYQYYLLDVIGFLSVITLATLSVLYQIIKFTYSLFKTKPNKAKKH